MKKQRKFRKLERDKRVSQQRRKRAVELLKLLGVWEALKSTQIKEELLTLHYPPADVVWADGQPANEEESNLLAQMEWELNHATFDCPLLGNHFVVQDFFRSVQPLMEILHADWCRALIPQDLLAAVQQQVRDVRAPVTMRKAILAAREKLAVALGQYGSIDTALFVVAMRMEFKDHSKNKPCIIFVVNRANIRQKSLTINGIARRAYQCGHSLGPEIGWVNWTSAAMGLVNENCTYPVYVQDHALDNLYRKEARAVFVQECEWLFRAYLWLSLREPAFHLHSREPDKFLVEYNVGHFKLGYLVAHRLPNFVVIETFLFLTMNGTPESKRLRQELGLARPDKEHLELDKIETFYKTDLGTDPELVAILERCGCAHLFTLRQQTSSALCRSGYASEFRKHLRLDERK